MEKTADNLLFSFDAEIDNPNSRAGKVWRIHMENGVLNVGDCIMIASVNISNTPKSEFFNVEAAVKSIHTEMDFAVEGIKETENARKGDIVGINIRDCYCGKRKIDKKDIKITKYSAGFSVAEQLNYHNEFYIRFVDCEKALIVKELQHITILWFGKMIPAKVIKFSDSIDAIHVKLLYDRKIPVPQNSDIIKKIVMRVEDKGKTRYISGIFDFNREI